MVMNARDYDNLIENLYIAQNRYLTEKLMKSREQFACGGVSVRELIDDEGSDD